MLLCWKLSTLSSTSKSKELNLLNFAEFFSVQCLLELPLVRYFVVAWIADKLHF